MTSRFLFAQLPDGRIKVVRAERGWWPWAKERPVEWTIVTKVDGAMLFDYPSGKRVDIRLWSYLRDFVESTCETPDWTPIVGLPPARLLSIKDGR